MAENKKSFILYVDLIHTVEKMSNEDAGELLKHILRYVNDKDPVPVNILIELVFEHIKHQLKRDLKTWEDVRHQKSNSGHIGGIRSGESRRSKQTKQMLQNRSKPKQTEANEAVNVNVNANVYNTGEEFKKNSLEYCTRIALLDSKWIKDSGATEQLINDFIKHLNGTGETEKTLLDFKKHFYHWKKKNSTEQIKVRALK